MTNKEEKKNCVSEFLKLNKILHKDERHIRKRCRISKHVVCELKTIHLHVFYKVQQLQHMLKNI